MPSVASVPEPSSLRGFPRAHIETAWRLHRREYVAEIYFRGPSRFTPADVPKLGVLYLVSSPTDALAEVVQPASVVSSDFFADRLLSELQVSHVNFADLRSRSSLAFGLSLEITTSADYDLPQRWASALALAGFGGLAFPSQRVPGGTLLAVFGEEGVAEGLPVVSNQVISLDDLERAGVRAVPRPSISDLEPLP
jgi:hypothetical protein